MEYRRNEIKSERNYSQFINNIFDDEVKCDGGIIVPNSFTMNYVKDNKKRGEMFGYDFYKQLYVERNFSTIGSYVWYVVSRYNKVLLYDIIGYIATGLKYNSNLIRIQQDAIRAITGRNINGRDFVSAISILEDKSIIRRTELRSIYTVNPVMIYKGNIEKLAKVVFDDNFNSPIIENDKLCLDKIAIFEEFEDKKPVLIKNAKYYIKEDDDKSLENRVRIDFSRGRK